MQCLVSDAYFPKAATLNRIHGRLVHRLPRQTQKLDIRAPSTLAEPILQSKGFVTSFYLASICADICESGRIQFVRDWILRSRTLLLTLHTVAL